MRKIQLHEWDAKTAEGKSITENTITMLSILLTNKKPEELPRGIDNFRLFSRLSYAFDKAEKEGVLVLEESDYAFLKKLIESDLLSTWGMNKDIVKAVDNFLNAKEEK